MAETSRERIIANRGKKKLSDKQIRFFGSPAQKAALARRRSAARTKPNRSGHKKRSTTSRKNAGGELIGFTLAGNTGTKKGHRKMAATKKHKSKSAKRKPAGYGKSKYRPNKGRSSGSTMGHKHKPRRRHNLGRSSGGIVGLVSNAVFVIAGAVGSKLITQMILTTKNTGVMGYAGNAIVGFGMWLFAEKVLRKPGVAAGLAAGTAVQVVLRLINDYTPFGQYIAQLGMGDYQAQAFVTPQILVDPFNRATIAIPGAWQPPALPAPSPQTPSAAAAAAGVGSYGGGNLYGGQSNLY